MFIRKFVKGIFHKNNNKDKVKSKYILLKKFKITCSLKYLEKCAKIESEEEVKKVVFNSGKKI